MKQASKLVALALVAAFAAATLSACAADQTGKDSKTTTSSKDAKAGNRAAAKSGQK